MLDSLFASARQRKARIILPEQDDPRVLEAAVNLVEQKLATPVFLSAPKYSIPGAEVFGDLANHQNWRDRAVNAFYHLHRDRGITHTDAHAKMENDLYLAGMLLKLGYIDGCVAGSISPTSNVLRAGLSCVGLHAASNLVSSTFLMLWPDRVLSFGDCVVNPRPTPGELARIAVDSAITHQRITGEEPLVAFLSFSTHGSAAHPELDRIHEALAIAKRLAPSLSICGELQADAALIPEVAAAKAKRSCVAGKANVLVFPDLNAGNIGYKLTERLGGARAVGPVLQGLSRPWMSLKGLALWMTL